MVQVHDIATVLPVLPGLGRGGVGERVRGGWGSQSQQIAIILEHSAAVLLKC